MTRPDSMLVASEMITAAKDAVAECDFSDLLTRVREWEPALAEYLGENAVLMVGMAALTGAPTEVCRGLHEGVVRLVATCLEAYSRGTYALWEGTEVGRQLRCSIAEASGETAGAPAPVDSPAGDQPGPQNPESSANAGSATTTVEPPADDDPQPDPA